MDVLHAALKKKVGELHKMVGGDTSGDPSHSAMGDDQVGQLGHQPTDGKKDDEDPNKNEDLGQAPEVNDDPMHKLEGGGDKSSKLEIAGHMQDIGKTPDESALLKNMTSGQPSGGPKSLGARAHEGMKKRLSEISKK